MMGLTPREGVDLPGEEGCAPRPHQRQVSPSRLGAHKVTASPRETHLQGLKPPALSDFLRSNTFFLSQHLRGKKSTWPY